MTKPKQLPQVPPSTNGDGPPGSVGEQFAIPADALIVIRNGDDFGYVINSDSTVPLQAWPTVLRRMAVLLERTLVDGA